MVPASLPSLMWVRMCSITKASLSGYCVLLAHDLLPLREVVGTGVCRQEAGDAAENSRMVHPYGVRSHNERRFQPHLCRSRPYCLSCPGVGQEDPAHNAVVTFWVREVIVWWRQVMGSKA